LIEPLLLFFVEVGRLEDMAALIEENQSAEQTPQPREKVCLSFETVTL